MDVVLLCFSLLQDELGHVTKCCIVKLGIVTCLSLQTSKASKKKAKQKAGTCYGDVVMLFVIIEQRL